MIRLGRGLSEFRYLTYIESLCINKIYNIQHQKHSEVVYVNEEYKYIIKIWAHEKLNCSEVSYVSSVEQCFGSLTKFSERHQWVSNIAYQHGPVNIP